MLRSTRVRVTKSPTNRPELLSKEGVVLGLIPVATNPLQCRIQVADEIVDLPSHLDDFPREKPLFYAFYSQFYTDMRTQETEEVSSRPLYRVRQIFTSIGKSLDAAIQENISNPKIILQNISQSQLLSLDILTIKIKVVEFSPGVLWRLPVLVVAYSLGTVGNMDLFLKTLQPGQQMSEIQAETHEMELLTGIMEANARRMDAQSMAVFQSQTSDPRQRIGVIAPIRTEAQASYYQQLGDHCSSCSASECKLMKCSRCKKVRYCCKTCQKVDWMKHKVTCTKV